MTRPAAPDFETQAARRRWFARLAVGVFLAGSLGVLMLGASRLTGQAVFGFLVWLPLFAWFASRWLVGAGGALVAWSRRQIWGPLQGRHHALDDVWVRIEGDGRGRFRLLAADVFRYLGRPGDELACRKLAVRFPPGGLFADREGVWWFGEAAAVGYLHDLARRHDARALRLVLWLEREVLPPLRRQAERSE